VARVDRSAERAKQDYVKAILQLGAGLPVRAADLARYLDVSRAAVTKSRRILERARLVQRASARMDLIALTPRGKSLATRMLRRHRLIETFLHRSLGVPLVELHAQAEAIEHVINDDIAARLERFLGNPQADPHGHPIPAAHRDIPAADASLAQVTAGDMLRIASIPDRDPVSLRHLVEQRILPGLEATLVSRDRKGVRLKSASGEHVVESGLAPLIGVRVRRRPRNGA